MDKRARLAEKGYAGEDFNCGKELENGPVKDRKCTDIFCYGLFALFLVSLFGISVYGYAAGAPYKLIAPLDANGKFCGFSKGYEDYPYLYIAGAEKESITSMFSSTLCVKTCPTAGQDMKDQCKTTDATSSCDEYGPAYATFRFVRVCLPDVSKLPESFKEKYVKIYDTYIGNSIGPYISDLGDTWFVILGSVLLCVIVSLLYIAAMKVMARVLAWLSIVLILVGLIGSGAFFWYLDGKIDAENPAEQHDYYLWSAIACWALAFVYMIAIFFLWKSLSISIAIIECASDFVGSQKRSVLVPVCSFLILLVAFVCWVAGMICIASVGKISSGGEGGSQVRHVEWNQATRGLVYYMFFGFLWVMAFLIACAQFVLIVGVCTWYFSHNSDAPGDASFTDGLKWIFQYHLGSLAFGSFIVAVVWAIRITFEYIRKKIESGDPTGNPAVRCVLCCCSCCLACIDKFVQFINKNAYIQIALSSENFCESAVNAFCLIIKHAAKFSFVSGIGNVFMTLGKMAISSITCLICFVILDKMQEEGIIQSPFAPLIVIFMVSYLISSVFISVFSVASNTILQCFLVDTDIAEQNGFGEAMHRPESLDGFVLKIKKDDVDLPEHKLE